MAPHATCHLLPWTRLAVGAETVPRAASHRQPLPAPRPQQRPPPAGPRPRACPCPGHSEAGARPLRARGSREGCGRTAGRLAHCGGVSPAGALPPAFRPRSGWALAATAEGTEARAQQVTGAVPLVLDVEQRVDSAPDAQWVEQVGQVLHGLRAQSAASEPRGAAAMEDAVWPVRPTGRSAPRARLTWAVTPTAAAPTRLARTSQLDGAEHTREETGSGAPATGGDCCPSRPAVPVCVLGTQADVR